MVINFTGRGESHSPSNDGQGEFNSPSNDGQGEFNRPNRHNGYSPQRSGISIFATPIRLSAIP